MSKHGSRWIFWVVGIIGLQLLVACGKRCRDTEMLPYPAELNVYLKPYRLGSWWVYESNTGLRDSVHLTEYKETLHFIEMKGKTCLGLPLTNFALRTSYMDTTGMVYIRYTGTQHNAMAFVSLEGDRYHGWVMLEFSHDLQSQYTNAYKLDTILASVSYANALRVDRNDYLAARNLNSIVLAPEIGIVAYINDTDTFTLTEYHVP